MHYLVKDEQFVIGEGKGKYRSPLTALDAAIRLAAEFAQAEPVDVLKVDETGVHVAYSVNVQPRKGTRIGWHDVKDEK